MSNNRRNAMAWWSHDLSYNEKVELCREYFFGRKPKTLTGSEIEQLWKVQ
jgi:hypothetical protein